MVTFACEACGKSVTAKDEHVGRKVKCPQCAQPTTVRKEPPVLCGNCDRQIGRLEQKFTWEGSTVCGPCHQVLSVSRTNAQPAAPAPPPSPAATPPPPPAPTPVTAEILVSRQRILHLQGMLTAALVGFVWLLVVVGALFLPDMPSWLSLGMITFLLLFPILEWFAWRKYRSLIQDGSVSTQLIRDLAVIARDNVRWRLRAGLHGGLALLLFGGALALPFVIGNYLSRVLIKLGMEEGGTSTGVVVFASVIASIVIAIASIRWMIHSICPKCQTAFAAVLLRRQELSRMAGTKELATVKTVYNMSGSPIAHIDATKTINTTTIVSQYTCRCKYCGHVWNRRDKKPFTN